MLVDTILKLVPSSHMERDSAPCDTMRLRAMFPLSALPNPTLLNIVLASAFLQKQANMWPEHY
jgi:hypothetical protein